MVEIKQGKSDLSREKSWLVVTVIVAGWNGLEWIDSGYKVDDSGYKADELLEMVKQKAGADDWCWLDG